MRTNTIKSSQQLNKPAPQTASSRRRGAQSQTQQTPQNGNTSDNASQASELTENSNALAPNI